MEDTHPAVVHTSTGIHGKLRAAIELDAKMNVQAQDTSNPKDVLDGEKADAASAWSKQLAVLLQKQARVVKTDAVAAAADPHVAQKKSTSDRNGHRKKPSLDGKRGQTNRKEQEEIRAAIQLRAVSKDGPRDKTFVVQDCGTNFDGVCAALRKRGYTLEGRGRARRKRKGKEERDQDTNFPALADAY
jgi:hypothetical protein